MPANLHQPAFTTRRIVTLAVAAAGLVLSLVAFRDSRTRERERAEAEISRLITVRHTLTRQVLGRYEDALFSLSALFVRDGGVSRTEFIRAARGIEARTPGAQAYEWVPAVGHAQRAEFEAALQPGANGEAFQITEFDSLGRPVRAPDRPAYLPIAYVEPLVGNERALGYDLLTGPTRADLDQARESRQLTLSRPIRLAQEKSPDQLGVIMILAIWRTVPSAPAPDAEQFSGHVQAVFRTQDLLDRTRASQPDTVLDMLFLDAQETDPTRRILSYRPAGSSPRFAAAPTEKEFRRSCSAELSIPIGGRDWRVLYRPREGWIEEQFTALAWVRAAGVLALTALISALIHVLWRRAERIEGVVTERTAQLAESRRELQSLLHALPGMAFRCRYDEKLSVLFVSDGALALTGRPAAEFISGCTHFRDFIHAEDLDRVRTATLAALDARRDFETEYRLRLPDSTEKWVLSRGCGVYTPEGRLDSFEGLVIDITAHKKSERERIDMERKLLEGHRLESLGVLAGGIAHDFNNLLTGILGHANLSRLTLTAASPVDPYLRSIETASLRAAEICRQMLAYAGKGRFVVGPVDLSALASAMVPLLEVSIARRATLRLAVAPALPAVMGDSAQLQQIVMNLVLNAADASSDRSSEIVLTTGVFHTDGANLDSGFIGPELIAGDYVFLEVRDHGSGIAPENLSKIYDPFYTTKFAGRGLGLAAVLGITRGHNGTLHVASAPGQGSTFRLLLPQIPPTSQPPALFTSTKSKSPWRGLGRVLVIDDEEPVRTIAVNLLTSLGLVPQAAHDGPAGLAVFHADPGAFRLVVLDLLMPGSSGEETLAALRQIRPDVRVLLMSGYHEGDLLRRLAAPGSRLDFLAKPFTRGSLADKLRALLDDE